MDTFVKWARLWHGLRELYAGTDDQVLEMGLASAEAEVGGLDALEAIQAGREAGRKAARAGWNEDGFPDSPEGEIDGMSFSQAQMVAAEQTEDWRDLVELAVAARQEADFQLAKGRDLERWLEISRAAEVLESFMPSPEAAWVMQPVRDDALERRLSEIYADGVRATVREKGTVKEIVVGLADILQANGPASFSSEEDRAEEADLLAETVLAEDHDRQKEGGLSTFLLPEFPFDADQVQFVVDKIGSVGIRFMAEKAQELITVSATRAGLLNELDSGAFRAEELDAVWASIRALGSQMDRATSSLHRAAQRVAEIAKSSSPTEMGRLAALIPGLVAQNEALGSGDKGLGHWYIQTRLLDALAVNLDDEDVWEAFCPSSFSGFSYGWPDELRGGSRDEANLLDSIGDGLPPEAPKWSPAEMAEARKRIAKALLHREPSQQAFRAGVAEARRSPRYKGMWARRFAEVRRLERERKEAVVKTCLPTGIVCESGQVLTFQNIVDRGFALFFPDEEKKRVFVEWVGQKAPEVLPCIGGVREPFVAF